MKVLLIDNLLFEGGVEHPRFDLQPHLGLMSLVAVLRIRGIEAEIYDPKRDLTNGELALNGNLYDDVAARIAARNADIVGFTALGCNFPFVVRTAQRLKVLRPGRPVLLGGPHASILHREILECFDCFDVVVRHEAEETLPRVLNALAGKGSLLSVPSTTCRTASQSVFSSGGAGVLEDLDSLPMPAYDAYPITQLGLDEIRIEAGRGCPFSCTFCSTATFFGRQYRLKSPARLLDEMDTLHATYGFRSFKLNHDLFTVNRTKVEAFCAAVSSRDYAWSCSARMDCVDESLLVQMKAAGCRQIYFGVETGSDRMQHISRKKLDLALVAPTLDVTERLGLRTITSFIAGYPQETRADQEATLDLVANLHVRPAGLNIGQLHLLTPEPGTALIDEFRDHLAFDEHVSEFNFPMLDAADRMLVGKFPTLFPNHHYFPSLLPRLRNVFVTTLWVTLYELGRDTMRWLLSPFDGRLSQLVEEVFEYLQKVRPENPVADVQALLAFVEHRFGRDHPTVSVLRFSTSRARLLRAATPPPVQEANTVRAPQASDDEDAFVLSQQVALLLDIHDVPTLLSSQSRPTGPGCDEPVPGDPGPRSDKLLLMTAQGLRLFELGAETARWLARFATPRRYIEWDSTSAVADSAIPMPEDIRMLVDLGVLKLAWAQSGAT